MTQLLVQRIVWRVMWLVAHYSLTAFIDDLPPPGATR